MSFKHFITEASFNSKDVPEVIEKVSKIVSDRLGKKLYPYNQTGYQELMSGGKTYQCYLFFMDDCKAVRFNTINGTFDSIEIWNKYKTNGIDEPKSDFTIRLDGMNILKVIDSLVNVIKKPREGTYRINVSEDTNQNKQMIFESNAAEEAARLGLQNLGYGRYGREIDGEMVQTHRVDKLRDRLVDFHPTAPESRKKQVKDPHDWHMMAIKTFGDTKNLSRLSWSDVEIIAAKNGVTIPGWVRASGVGKGKNKVFSSVPSAHLTKPAETMQQAGENKGVQYFAKISPRDPITNKFTSVKDDEYAQRLTKMMDAALNSPSNDVIEQEMVDPDTLFGRMSDLIKLIVKGVSPSLFIYGGPGIGKTFIVNKTLKEAGLKKNQDYFIVKGKITPTALYQTLYTHRNGNTMLVFDDADSAFRTEDSANILKAALDSYEEREISYSSARTINVDKWSDEKRERYEEKLDKQLLSIGDDEDDEDFEDNDFDSNPDAAFPDNGRGMDKEKKKKKKEEKVTKLPSKFKFDGKIIFISNLDKSQVDDAVLSRSYKIDMEMTAAQRFKRMESILPYVVPEVEDIELKKRVMEAIKVNHKLGKLDLPSMRMLESGVKVAASGLPNWKDLLDYI